MFENIHLNQHSIPETQIRDVPRQNIYYEPGYFYKLTISGSPVQPGTGFFLMRAELNKGELVLNREKHPIFDTTNCVQGTYVM
jgi:hypothetical protein